MHPTQEHILTHLAASDGPVSGSALAEAFGLSRTAVWKHVEAMRRQGMRIRSESGRGYRLESDRFTAENLTARLAIDAPARLGRDIRCLEETDSTNLEVLRAAEAGAAEAAAHGGVGLGERLEEDLLLFLRNTNAGVLNGNLHGRLVVDFVDPLHGDGHFAFFGEFESVVDQV